MPENSIECIYCHQHDAYELKTNRKSSSDGWHYYKCFNPKCSKFFTEVMRHEKPEKWEELLKNSNILNKAHKLQCPYCGKNAFEVPYKPHIDLFYCECKKEFHRHNYKNILKIQKIQKAPLNELVKMI